MLYCDYITILFQFFFCWSSIPLVYAFSFLFSNSLIAFALTILSFFFSALVSLITPATCFVDYQLLSFQFGLVMVFVLDNDDAESANNFFVLLPSYA